MRPRFIDAGTSYMVQRRTVHRRFYLKPTARTSGLLRYCLFYAVRETGVQVHEFIALSNHYHVVLTDPKGLLPKFMHRMNFLISRALNSRRGRFGAFWENEQYAAPRLPEPADIFRDCVYTLANPCEANLVTRTSKWTGLNSYDYEYGEEVFASRPDWFFGEDMPETIPFRLVRPNVRPDLSDAQLRNEIRRAVREKELEYDRRRNKARQRVLGMHRVLSQSIDDQARSREERFGVVPTVSGRSRWAVAEVIQRNRERLAIYRKTWLAWCAGDRDVEFPPGTYLMRVQFGCKCASGCD